MATLSEVSEAMRMVIEEQGVPRNVREKMQQMIAETKSGKDYRILADQLLMQLEDLQSDVNIPSYVRTHIWSISSMLENLEE